MSSSASFDANLGRFFVITQNHSSTLRSPCFDWTAYFDDNVSLALLTICYC